MVATLRVKFLTNPQAYFAAIRKAYGVSWFRIARDVRVSVRTTTSWRLQENTMPLEIAEKWAREFGILLPGHTIINLDEKRRTAGLLGGKARQMLYGNVGTPQGRRQGGLQSLKTHRKNPLSPFVARPVVTPSRDAHFAELIGAILGD